MRAGDLPVATEVTLQKAALAPRIEPRTGPGLLGFPTRETGLIKPCSSLKGAPVEHGLTGIWPSTCSIHRVENRTEPRTPAQWARYIVVAAIALGLVWWMLRLYVL